MQKISKVSAKGNPASGIHYDSEGVSEHVSKSELIDTVKKALNCHGIEREVLLPLTR